MSHTSYRGDASNLRVESILEKDVGFVLKDVSQLGEKDRCVHAIPLLVIDSAGERRRKSNFKLAIHNNRTFCHTANG